MESLGDVFRSLSTIPGLEPSTTYKYQSLSKTDGIRLLRLEEGMGPIHCLLEEVGLEDVPYDTLSYTWGSPVDGEDSQNHQGSHHFIICNDDSLRVTENLFDALYQFRAADYFQPF
jgi:hypothetical protein